MTNFEKILKETSRQDMAEALSACFEGKCDECPALELCNQMGDQEEIGCVYVMLLWLDMEAEVLVMSDSKLGYLFAYDEVIVPEEQKKPVGTGVKIYGGKHG